MVYSEESSMRSAAVHFYEYLLHEDQSQTPLLDGISYNSINIEGVLDLKKDLSKEELRNAFKF